MNPELRKLLDYLAKTLDQERQAEIKELHRRALTWKPVDRLPLVLSYPLHASAPFKPYPHSQIFDDPETMLYNELVHAWDIRIAYHDRVGDDLPCTIRCNFGCVVIASLFGGRVEQVEENPPWIRPFETLAEFKRALDRDPLDFSQGWSPRVIEMYQFYRQVLSDYPKLQELIKLVLPDLQGPIDTAELLRGSALYMDFYDNPDLVSQAMSVIATAQVGFARYLAPYLSEGLEGFSHQHGFMICGNILIRDDSSIMISPETYREQVAPHDEFVLRELSGGGIHCCGRFDHAVEEFLALPSIRCLDLGDPQMNDLDTIYATARERRIPLIRIQVDEEELISGRVMERFPTGVSMLHAADSFKDACRIMTAYKQATEGR